ncbi:superoxide dismutase family protein [Inhella gelatinilytica]|uniref:Superoxide dismutase [Cu-Zn] n=1 Tax=Inhella gelatinilytica TaxID=2795030 RepID=A0A931NDU9_9BURK|nr:superoxide dismutase family protein [Inhella gelatinilytica]MBH9553009.1 superoxide dismutase family protein [Inhella gelatinilytica]
MNRIHTLALACASLLLGACAGPGPQGKHAGHEAHGGMDHQKMAMATLSPTATSGVSGMVMFHAHDGHLMAHVMLSGLAPGSTHGFHVHEKGNCASADFTSAGPHFNPTGKPHGPQEGERHVGDLPNLTADAQGKVNQKLHLHGLSLRGGAGIIGRGLIVHADADDFKTQPTGNSGPRIACGVIAGH